MQTSTEKILKIFRYGAIWSQADFHLHTRADREFKYTGGEDRYVSDYVSALRAAGIRIGVIANHNKFDVEEYKTLRKIALKEEILLLPGVELSVGDGSGGIHTVVVFSDEWLEGDQDHINPFLSVAFQGKTPRQYEQENGRSILDLRATIEKLESYKKDFFLIFAHVEEKSGLWRELSGGRMEDFGRNESFRRRTLGFQKVRSHSKPDRANEPCRAKIKNWLKDWYPAEVEGSDCKSLESIKAQNCFLKVGDLTFESVKYALLDHPNRVAAQPAVYPHSHIRSIRFDGGVLNGQEIAFSPELNCLIGIRGSGKSSILECLRYALDIPFGEKAMDLKYKTDLLAHVLGSGGKIVVEAVDRRGQRFEVHRIFRESPDVFAHGKRLPGLSIRETVIHQPIYFGQKDLSSSGEGFERDLVEKLLGEKLHEIRRRIEEQKDRVLGVVKRLEALARGEDQIKEYEDKKQDAKFRLELYQRLGVEDKLQRQLGFEADGKRIVDTIALVERCLDELGLFLQRYEDDASAIQRYTSTQNAAVLEGFFGLYDRFVQAIAAIKESYEQGSTCLDELRAEREAFIRLEQDQKDLFAEVQRQIASELRSQGLLAVQMDDFLKLRRTMENAIQMLDALKKQQATLRSVENELLVELGALNDLWREEYRLVQIELEKVNTHHTSLTLEAEFKGDKAAMLSFMKELFKGSHIRENTLKLLVDDYADFGEMRRRWIEARAKSGSNPEILDDYFRRNLATLLTWQPPNRFMIKYRDKELKHHSLGQRASALILFVLSQQNNDLVIIDQPEDDLDNQTIYEDVIKLIREMKPRTQFVFATHNANFPVLGDSEQVLACYYAGEKVSICSGSVDCTEIQQEIVNIMEGGEEAFRRRKEIYQIWKPRN